MFLRTSLAAAAAALILVACGGGDDPAFSYDKVVVFGDSLSDVGTYKVGTVLAAGGGRWIVNGVPGSEIWVERVAAGLGLVKPCAAETGLLPNVAGVVGAAVATQPGCFNYAQGSARITNPLGPNSVALQAVPDANNGGAPTQTLGLMAKPMQTQMAAHLSAVGGTYTGKELVTVLAGANDVFMELAFLGTGLGAANPAGAVANMAAHGTALGGLIKTQVLAKGAKRVLVLNVPYVSGTPYARSLDVAQPGTSALIDQMVTAFNAALAASLTNVAGLRLADFYTESLTQFNNPGNFGVSNRDDVACGPNALSNPPGSPGTALVCNGTNVIAGNVSRYQYADNVHPTPYGHQLIAEYAQRQLVAAGWN
ncbi:MAG: SGNH/GDSL hydrolase family protein [Hydrogenophaga sp.]|jgi:outer membrane lipase/esterase|nr:SGNH/GDSL hydrolase family protein [Hydrogenophaga sp.]